MKSHVILFLVPILFIFSLFTILLGQKSISFAASNRTYARALTNACVDALMSVDKNRTLLFDTKESRQKALEVFYEDIFNNMSAHATVRPDSILQNIPFVMLVDYNGFYIVMNPTFDSHGNTVYPRDIETMSAESNLNTWAENYSGTTVRFYLNDFVEVISPDGTVVSGKYEEIKGKVSLPFMASKDTFITERNVRIATSMEETIDYYLNTQGISINGALIGYDTLLSREKGSSTSRVIDEPTVISFLQGKHSHIFTYTFNIFAYAGGELTDSDTYKIVGDYYYPSNLVTGSTQKTVHGRVIVTDTTTQYFEGSMKDCADKGAFPDLSAQNKNGIY